MSDESTGTDWKGFLLPVATAGVALFGGLVVGGVAAWTFKPPTIQEVPRELTDAELSDACAPLVQAASSTLDEANDKVTTLVAAMQQKQTEVDNLEAEIKRRGAAGAALKQKLEQARAELAQVQQQLTQAIEEKKALVVELDRTVARLDRQKVKTREAREDSLSNQWMAFYNEAQLQVCERGNRKKLENCREAVAAALNPTVRDAFGHCIRSGQEAPALRLAEKGATLPRFARTLGSDEKVLQGWYIQLCDPTLPEAGRFADNDEEDDDGAPALPAARPTTGSPAGAEPVLRPSDPESLGKPGEEGLDELLENLDD